MGEVKHLRPVLILVLGCLTTHVFSQLITGGESEAWKAMRSVQSRPLKQDSIKRVFEKRWVVGASYGLRFLKLELEDTLTFTDFSETESIFGIEAGYFLTQRLQLNMTLDFLIAPKEEEFGSVMIGGSDGISIEGQGNGGLMITTGIGVRYYFMDRSKTRPYAEGQVGRMSALAAGGVGGFTLRRGRYDEREDRKEVFSFGRLGLGFVHRFSAIVMVDWRIGYSLASEARLSVGGLVSPDHLATGLTMSFILNSKKKYI